MKKISIHIPEPCHEDWNKMTPVEKGRYCQSCCKEVIDFSVMTDQEIFNFLSKPGLSTCGNFSDSQLNRLIKEPATPVKKKYWAILLSFLLPLISWNRLHAQRGKINVTEQKEQSLIRGDTIFLPDVSRSVKIKGTITDSLNVPVPFATIRIEGTGESVMADSNGVYNISTEISDELTLHISSVNYQSQVIRFLLGDLILNEITKNVVLTQSVKQLEEVIISDFGTSCGRFIAGGYSVKVSVSVVQYLVDTVRNIVNPFIKVFPNPAKRGDKINIVLQEQGKYTIQLFGNQSRIILQESISTSQNKQATSINVPSNISAGVYYITAIDQNSRKRFTQKLIIQ